MQEICESISLEQIKQAGAMGIASALYPIYRGEPWPPEEVLRRKGEIKSAGLIWSVVESFVVHNSIKLRSEPYRRYISAWKDSLGDLTAGAKTGDYASISTLARELVVKIK